eukprot:545874_1
MTVISIATCFQTLVVSIFLFWAVHWLLRKYAKWDSFIFQQRPDCNPDKVKRFRLDDSGENMYYLKKNSIVHLMKGVLCVLLFLFWSTMGMNTYLYQGFHSINIMNYKIIVYSLFVFVAFYMFEVLISNYWKFDWSTNIHHWALILSSVYCVGVISEEKDENIHLEPWIWSAYCVSCTAADSFAHFFLIEYKGKSITKYILLTGYVTFMLAWMAEITGVIILALHIANEVHHIHLIILVFAYPFWFFDDYFYSRYLYKKLKHAFSLVNKDVPSDNKEHTIHAV